VPDVLAITGPIFLLIGLGFAAVRFRLYPGAGLPALGNFVVRFALPAMLFKSLAERSIAEVMNPRYLAAYAVGSLLVFGAGLAWARWARGQRVDAAAMTGMGMSCANSAFVGFPVALQVVGPEAAVALALTMMVENFLMIPLCLGLADSASHRHDPFWKAMARSLAGLRTNPIVMAIAAGFAFALAGIGLPGPVARGVDMLAGASAAVSLFYIGGTLVGLRVGTMLAQVFVVSLGKLALHPLAVLAALLAVGPVAPPLQIAAVLFACAPMLGIYPLLGHKYGQQGVNAASLLVCTVAAFVTIGAVIWALQASAVFGSLR
jgi:malonate transporter and related proteins